MSIDISQMPTTTPQLKLPGANQSTSPPPPVAQASATGGSGVASPAVNGALPPRMPEQRTGGLVNTTDQSSSAPPSVTQSAAHDVTNTPDDSNAAKLVAAHERETAGVRALSKANESAQQAGALLG